jgi:L,D-transpeptidase YcbB
MRVENPAKYAEIMTRLGMPGSNYTAEKIQSMFGNSEIDLRFTTPIPVHITYQTAFVDESGHLQIREDLYGRDTQTLAALKGGNRRDLEIPVARAGSSQGRPPVRLPNGVAGAYSDWNSGQSFFDRLFGNPIQPPPQPVGQRRASRGTTR